MKAFPGVNLSNKRLKSNFEHNIALFSIYTSYEIHVTYVYFDCFLNWSICEKQLHILTKNSIIDDNINSISNTLIHHIL